MSVKGAALLALTLGVAAVSATAQEVEDQDEAGVEESVEAPRRSIRVLQHPYDIASFYRSRDGEAYFGDETEYLVPGSPYSLASYYRQRRPGWRYGYGPFWSGGYSSRDRSGFVIGYRRSIGENGDLFLFAPTFLAPIGPLTGVFFEPR